jgi:Rieske Fe-S protein
MTEAPIETLLNGIEVARQLATSKLGGIFAKSVEELEPGEAAIVDVGGEKAAVYRDGAGMAHKVKAACTHMGCDVKWNTAERSWDCPCHGSRFRYDGSVIQGPAIRPLEPVP